MSILYKYIVGFRSVLLLLDELHHDNAKVVPKKLRPFSQSPTVYIIKWAEGKAQEKEYNFFSKTNPIPYLWWLDGSGIPEWTNIYSERCAPVGLRTILFFSRCIFLSVVTIIGTQTIVHGVDCGLTTFELRRVVCLSERATTQFPNTINNFNPVDALCICG